MMGDHSAKKDHKNQVLGILYQRLYKLDYLLTYIPKVITYLDISKQYVSNNTKLGM